MNYNTSREQLIIPEYGRHVQKMVKHATSIEDKEERQKCVQAIISYMGQMNPHFRDIPDYKHKLWDHLYIMSDFKLEVDSPYEKPSPEKLSEKPDLVKYPKTEFSFSYYGKHIETMIDTAINMKDGDEKYILTGMIVNHMKKCYIAWSKSSIDDQMILKHLDKLSKGKLQLHEDFIIIEDGKATAKKTVNIKKNIHKHNNKKKRY